jgi:F-type H+-transporting ATPase subunit delta
MTSHRNPARCYAVALGELAQEAGVLNRVTEELVTIERLASQSAEYKQSISSTGGGREIQERVLRRLAEGRTHELTLNFLLLLVRKRRLAYLSDIAAELQAYTDEINNVQPVTVYTAVALTEHQQDEIAVQLRRQLGRQIRLRCIANPDLLGGMIIQVGKKTYDGSLAGKLQRLLRQVNPHYYNQLPLFSAPLFATGLEADGEQMVRVIAAVPLAEDLYTAITAQLEKRLGRPVKLDVHIQPEILGGLIIQVGDRVVDDSIAGRLQRLFGVLMPPHDDKPPIWERSATATEVAKRVVTVTTAAPMPPDLAQVLLQRLERKLGSAVEMVFRLQPEMLGGVRIQVDNQVYEDSLADRLAQVVAAMNENRS